MAPPNKCSRCEIRHSVMAITALSHDLWLSPSDSATQTVEDWGEMIRNRWRLFAWSLLGAALLVLASWPLMIWWHVSNGVPLIPAAFETLAMATRCPRPWACSARRLGRLGRWLSRAPYHAPNRARLRPSVGHSKSRAALPCSACAIEFLDPYARARAYGPCGKLVRHCRRATARQIVAGYQSGCALPYAGNFQGIYKKIQCGLELGFKPVMSFTAKHPATSAAPR
jgi:hypothetical protein